MPALLARINDNLFLKEQKVTETDPSSSALKRSVSSADFTESIARVIFTLVEISSAIQAPHVLRYQLFDFALKTFAVAITFFFLITYLSYCADRLTCGFYSYAVKHTRRKIYVTILAENR